jgi:hypothetical protein
VTNEATVEIDEILSLEPRLITRFICLIVLSTMLKLDMFVSNYPMKIEY